MRDTAPSAGGVLSEHPAGAPERPRVAITAAGCRTFGFDWVEALLPAAASIPADFLLAVQDDGALGELPPNVRRTGWLPTDVLYAGCAGVVHDGDAGAVSAAVVAGTSQMVVPHPGDQSSPRIADAVRERGIGLSAPPGEVSSEALGQLVADDALRAGAAAVRRELAALPSPADMAARIVGLAG
ncbi:glycosyltransferase [Saccharopolyspora sp. CA-218241]|uniref:glycosyltransferase n=1 Tax=Saccharopolyspora sp. CA-218241 TaxID=3240027 RepID=UPI003D97D56E